MEPALDLIDAKSVFDHASRFHHAGVVLRLDIEGSDQHHMPAYMVMSTFTSELYLKCLYAIEKNGERIRSHDLRKIFNELSENTKKALSQTWIDLIDYHNSTITFLPDTTFKIPNDLAKELEVCGRMFEELRYFYERVYTVKHWYLSPLPDVLRSFILKVKPDWADDCYIMVAHAPEDVPPYPFAAYGLSPSKPDTGT